MNLLVDPGAEFQSPAWVVTDPADLGEFTQEQAHTGTWSLLFRRINLLIDGTPFWFSSQFTQSNIPLILGEPMNVSAWIYTTIKSTQHGIRIDYDRGNGVYVQNSFTNLNLGWTQVTIPTFTAVGAVGRIRLTTIGPLSAASLSYVDDVVWDWPTVEIVARRSKHTAFNAVIARLKTITGGATYHLDLGQRVYPMLFLPEEKASVPLPYACFPLIDTFTFEDNERATVGVDWENQIHVFIGDTSSDPLLSTVSEAAAKAMDDLVKAFLADGTLGGACQGLVLVGGASEAGALMDGRAYAEVIFTIRVKQITAVDVLGPE